MSSGEFVGIVADNPDTIIKLKAFHCKVINDHKALEREAAAYQPIPPFKSVDNAIVQRNFQQIKQDVQDIIESEMEGILNDPSKTNLIMSR